MCQNIVAQDWAGQRGFKVWGHIEMQVRDQEAAGLQNELFATIAGWKIPPKMGYS